MAQAKTKPTFFWQGLLIVLPVLFLAVVGFISLRQDKLLAEREAQTQAKQLAERIAGEVQSALDPITAATSGGRNIEVWKFINESRDGAFQATKDPIWQYAHHPPEDYANYRQPMRIAVLDNAGNLIYPSPRAEQVTPGDLSETNLYSDQRTLWRKARDAEFASTNLAQAIGFYEQFLAGKPSHDFAAQAQFTLGLLREKAGLANEAAWNFVDLLSRFPEKFSEAGTPLRQLAKLHLLRLGYGFIPRSGPEGAMFLTAAGRDDFESFYSDLLIEPTQLTPQLLSLAAHMEKKNGVAPEFEELWKLHEECRAIFNEYRASLLSQPSKDFAPLFHWLKTDRAWLVWRLRLGDRGYDLLLARPADEVRARIESILRGEKIVEIIHVPEYFGVEISAAGEKLTEVRHFTAVENQIDDLLAEHHESFHDARSVETGVHTLPDSSCPIEVKVYLTKADLFYAHQRQRQIWFQILIGAAAITALVGFVTAYRGFQRQVQVNELQSNFVSSVSHELRAPIASMRLMAEGLDRGTVTAPLKQKEYYHLMLQECRRLSSLIENVLDFSRIEQGRKQYEFEATDVLKLVTETVKIMEPYALEKGVFLECKLNVCGIAEEKLHPFLDARAIQQALVNLIDNAIKHSPIRGTVSVGADFRETALELWVEDHGPGIPPREYNRIFERFYRLGSELRRETQGVGIGLSIVKHIVEAHHGRVLIRSVVGKGSRFTIELPTHFER